MLYNHEFELECDFTKNRKVKIQIAFLHKTWKFDYKA